MPYSSILHFPIPVVLASSSPRREKLLNQIGVKFTVRPSHYNEDLVPSHLTPAEYVMHLALHKAMTVATEMYNENQSALIIGADTAVLLGTRILNKPTDAENARQMLRTLSDRTHTVLTGIAMMDSRTEEYVVDFQRTEVRFRELLDEEINAYVATGAPMDKAGSYGIQDDFGAVFVSEIRGDYYNVVGLPLELTYRHLREFGVRIPKEV
jgi:septum formation protein